MFDSFTLSKAQWAKGLLASALLAPTVASLPISFLFFADAPNATAKDLAEFLALGALSALGFVGLPALACGTIALTVAQRLVRRFGVRRSRVHILATGAALGGTSALPWAVLSEDLAVAMVLLGMGGATGTVTAALCHRSLARRNG